MGKARQDLWDLGVYDLVADTQARNNTCEVRLSPLRLRGGAARWLPYAKGYRCRVLPLDVVAPASKLRMMFGCSPSCVI